MADWWLLALVPLLAVLLLEGAGIGRYLRQRWRARRAENLADRERARITARYPTSDVGAGRAIASARYRAASCPAPCQGGDTAGTGEA